MDASLRLTLRQRLLLGFCAVGALVVVLLALGDRFIGDAAQRMDNTLAEQVRPLARLNSLQSQISRIRVLEVELPRLTDLFAATDQLEMMQSEAKSFDQQLAVYLAQPGVTDPESAATLVRHWRRYETELQSVRLFALSMQMEEAKRIATFVSAPHFKSIALSLKQMADGTEATAATAVAQAKAEHERQRMTFLGASLLGLAVLAPWFVLLARSVTLRLARLSDAAGQLAVGGQAGSIQVAGRDELSELGMAFNTMRAQVLEREAALRLSQDLLESRVAERTEALNEANKQLQYQAQYDSLTGLPNRLLALDLLQQAILISQRQSTMVALVFLDLDDFKKVNDSLGHSAGDTLIVQAAMRLRSTVRAQDTVARLGGDEFILILAGLNHVADAQTLCDKILQAFTPPFVLDDVGMVVTPSMGLALCPDHADEASQLLRYADLALYDAKEAGRNTYRHFNQSLYDSTLDRMVLEGQLRVALEQQQFHLVYQPLLRAHDARIVGVEALLRWTNAQGQTVPPDRFIPVAESAGLIMAIGTWVLEQACAQIAEWREAGATDWYMAVNVSPSQFRDAGLADKVRSLLAQHRLPGNALQLEVTEGVFIRNPPEVRQAMQALASMGVKLAMDDFGTGYSSLSYLKRFPFNTIKIDREFVRDIEADADDRALVTATIQMGHGLDLVVVAEGVETQGQLDYLRHQGCDAVQGYLFSRPLPAPALAAQWLARHEAPEQAR